MELKLFRIASPLSSRSIFMVWLPGTSSGQKPWHIDDVTRRNSPGNEGNSKANRSSNGSARPSKAFIFMRSRSKVSLTCTRILKATAHCSEVSLPTVLFRNAADSTQQKSPSFCFLPAWWVLSMAKERTAIRKARVQGIALKRAGFLQRLATRNPLIAGHLPR